MSQRTIQSKRLRYMCLIAFFIAIELIMKFTGLGNLPINPVLNVTLMNIPVAIGAILLGPFAGLILGIVFGITSFFQPMSPLVADLFTMDQFNTIVLCVVTRALMGVCCGWIARGLKRIDKTKTVSYFVSAFFAAFLNTLFFMGYLILVFYHTDPIQQRVAAKGAVNWFNFVILFVGINGILELIATTIIGGGVAKGVDYALSKRAKN